MSVMFVGDYTQGRKENQAEWDVVISGVDYLQKGFAFVMRSGGYEFFATRLNHH
jgi:hypothetical protein